jgi:hypothetical protein
VLDAVVLNRMVLARIRDLAHRKSIGNASEQDARRPIERERIQRALGLFPYPPRTELKATSREPLTVAGIQVERHVIESRPGLSVPILVFNGGGPVILNFADVLHDGKANPAMQAIGISLAHHGFTVINLEPPGKWSESAVTERHATGDAYEPSLRMGAPALGEYVWDGVRVLDWALSSREGQAVGVNGLGLGAEAAMLLFALDDRVTSCALAGAAGSIETASRLSRSWSQAAGIAYAGDFGDVLGLRAGAPTLLMSCADDPINTDEAVKQTGDKIKKYAKNARVRVASFLGAYDYNRRMRETAAAFFSETLKGMPAADYAYETMPLTDGLVRTGPAGTIPPSELDVLGDSLETNAMYGGAGVETFTNLLMSRLAEPYPVPDPELTPWGRHGRLEGPKAAETYTITDGDGAGGAISLPVKDLDAAQLSALGLSPAEFLAEVLHLLLPGAPEGWEPVGLTGDPLTAMIASVRTLVGKSDPSVVTREINADGPTASIVAAALARWRPGLVVNLSHTFSSWIDSAAGAQDGGLQPGARYREWRW